MKVEIIRDPAQLDKMAFDLVKDIKGMDVRIQQYLLSELIHIEQFRNVTRLNKFFSGLGRKTGTKVTAMHQFVQTFGNIRLNKKKEDRNYTVKEADGTSWDKIYTMRNERDTYQFWDVKRKDQNDKPAPGYVKCDTQEILWEAAQLRPWWEFRPEPPVRDFTFDMADGFLKLISSSIHALDMVKAKEEKKLDRNVEANVNSEFLGELVALAKKYGLNIGNAIPAELIAMNEQDMRDVGVLEPSQVPATAGKEEPVNPIPANKRTRGATAGKEEPVNPIPANKRTRGATAGKAAHH